MNFGTMMNIDEMKCNISHLLEDRGLTRDYKEPSVRLLLYHLYVAMDIYRYMTLSEKNKAGFWYRTFKNSYRLTGFLKERKRKRDKEKSPLHPSYKERETEVKEKDEKTSLSTERATSSEIGERQKAFWAECEQYIGKYERQMVMKFFYYWAEEMNGTGMMLWETKKSWNTKFRLATWSKRSFEVNDQAAELRLAKAKGKQQAASTADQQAVAAKREEDNARLEREIAERKQGAVSYEEYLKMKAAIKREQNQACLGFAEREQARCETSKVRYEGNAEIGTGT